MPSAGLSFAGWLEALGGAIKAGRPGLYAPRCIACSHADGRNKFLSRHSFRKTAMASSSLAKPPSHHRQTSQSTSASSSSVVTVQRAVSVSSRNGIYQAPSSLRSHSPNSASTVSTTNSARTHTPDLPPRPGMGYRPDSGHGLREGVGNLNRWSQSTASSKSSATHHRRNSFSNRLSESFSSFGGFSASQAVSPQKSVIPQHPLKENVQGSPEKFLPAKPPKLPPLVTLSVLSDAVDAANTPSTAATTTPTTADLLHTPGSMSGAADYFADQGAGEAAKKPRLGPPQPATLSSSFAKASPSPKIGTHSPVSQPSRMSHQADPARSMYSSRSSSRTSRSERHQPSQRRHSRNRDDPRKGSTGTEGESSASSIHSARTRPPKRKTYSQTIILSKALQKANHAVLLDNAQNFVGAMDAYADACTLLQRVMSTSATDEDREKLEAVVSRSDPPSDDQPQLMTWLQSNAYSHRISELQNTMEVSYGSDAGKALPEPPRERGSPYGETSFSAMDDWSEELSRSSTATVRPASRQPSSTGSQDAPSKQKAHPPRKQSLSHSPMRAEDRILLASEMAQTLQPPWFHVGDKILEASEMAYKQQQRRSPKRPETNAKDVFNHTARNLGSFRHRDNMPPPLSPRRPLSPVSSAELSLSPPEAPRSDHPSFSSTYLTEVPSTSSPRPSRLSREDDSPQRSHHTRQDTAESTSWLDTIDESGGSSSESVHSRSSSVGLRRKPIRAASGLTAAAYDAAFDAAVEAAYDEGFEPDDEDDDRPIRTGGTRFSERGYTSDARRNVEIAKEMVREAEIEAALAFTKEREKRRAQERLTRRDSVELEYKDDETDEEERMLEEMTRDYIMDDSEFDLQSKSALPRQSDSSGFSSQTWGSSIGSNPATAGTSLSTVAESSSHVSLSTAQLPSRPLPPPSHPPPAGALPPPPASSMATSSAHDLDGKPTGPLTIAAKPSPGVRERRLSGTHAGQLKIETYASPAVHDEAALRNGFPPFGASPVIPNHLPGEAPLASINGHQLTNLARTLSNSAHHQIARAAYPASSEGTAAQPAAQPAANVDANNSLAFTSGLTKVSSTDGESGQPNSPGLFSARALGLRKNFSSSSLKNKSFNGVSHDPLDTSPVISTTMQRKGPPPGVPTSGAANDRLPTDGIYLFESDIHAPTTPGVPNLGVTNPPLPLEPCPELALLRPFWFLRCIYQTIAHPRGGYISTRLFIPSSIWRVKNVKLKSVDEKISACDLLSAALSKLAQVDTFDDDAVLEEMQFLGNVIEQVQSSLSKKLGNEVGVLGTSALFKGSSATDDGSFHADTSVSKSSNAHSKSYLSSWRKLRPKTSGPGAIPQASAIILREGPKDGPTLESLPMTSRLDPQFPPRDLSRIHYGGPNSNYMSALARLCDAAQVLGKFFPSDRYDAFVSRSC